MALGILTLSEKNPLIIDKGPSSRPKMVKKITNTRDRLWKKTTEKPKTITISHKIVGQKLNYFRFKRLLADTYKVIPSKKEMKKLNAREVHHFPSLLLKAGEKLGVVAEKMVNGPNLIEDGIIFYRKCSINDDFPQSVRAHCLANLLKFNSMRGRNTDLSPFSRSLQKLAMRGLIQ